MPHATNEFVYCLIAKKDGRAERLNTHKLVAHIKKFSFGLRWDEVDIQTIVDQIVSQTYDGIKTYELDELVVGTVAAHRIDLDEYNMIAGRLRVSALHTNTAKRFSDITADVYSCTPSSSPAQDFCTQYGNFVASHAEALDAALLHGRDYNLSFDDWEAVSKHLLRVNGRIVERPQHLLMRAAVSMKADIGVDSVLRAYLDLSGTMAKVKARDLFHRAEWWSTS